MKGAELPEGRTVLTFAVGDAEYGIALQWVCAVRERDPRRRETGEVEFRGERLPLLELGPWLGQQREGSGSTLLIVGRDKAQAALGVDRPGSVLAAGEMRPWPDSCRPFVEGVLEGILPGEGGPLFVIDPEGACRAAKGRGEPSSQGGEGE